MNTELNDILELEGVKEYKESQWDHYSYNNSGVPRVTHILSQCRDSHQYPGKQYKLYDVSVLEGAGGKARCVRTGTFSEGDQRDPGTYPG